MKKSSILKDLKPHETTHREQIIAQQRQKNYFLSKELVTSALQRNELRTWSQELLNKAILTLILKTSDLTTLLEIMIRNTARNFLCEWHTIWNISHLRWEINFKTLKVKVSLSGAQNAQSQQLWNARRGRVACTWMTQHKHAIWRHFIGQMVLLPSSAPTQASLSSLALLSIQVLW